MIQRAKMKKQDFENRIALENLPKAFAKLSNDIYHALPGLSSSKLKVIAEQSTLHSNLSTHEDSEAKDFGSFLHAVILEPETLDTSYLRSDEPAPSRSTKEGKEIAQRFTEETGLQIVDSDDWKRKWFEWKYPGKKRISDKWESAARSIVELIDDHPIKAILANSQKELSLFWQEEGFLMKAKPDILMHNNMLVDLKTCASASPQSIRRSIEQFNYHWQLAFHARGIKAVSGIMPPALGWIFVETSPPYGISMVQMPDEMLDIANDCIEAAIMKYEYETEQIARKKFKHPYGTEWRFAKVSPWLKNTVERI